MTALECRNQLIEARRQFHLGLITVDELYAVTDAYIEAIKVYKAKTGNKKLRIPTRGYLLRAI